jgi:hypothetical protein
MVSSRDERRVRRFRSDISLNSEFEKQIPPPQGAEDRDLRVGMTFGNPGAGPYRVKDRVPARAPKCYIVRRTPSLWGKDPP